MHVRPVPKVSIFMALTTKIVTEKAKKWPKMARFWPKSRYNGRVMAREVFFYQCLWVTKFCAKFGCSRTPRTASVPNSFIVLRCMWKEPAPFNITTFTHQNQRQVVIIHTINSKNKMITDFELLVDCLPIILQAQCPISVLPLQATFPILPWVTVFHFIGIESDNCHSLTVPGADEKVISKVFDAVSWCWWKRWP